MTTPDPVATQSTIAAYGITMVPEESGDTGVPDVPPVPVAAERRLLRRDVQPGEQRHAGGAALPYLEKAKLYASTPEYQDIRKMITSLRPGPSSTASAGTGTPSGK